MTRIKKLGSAFGAGTTRTLACVLAIGAIGAGLASAAIPDSQTGEIHACYQKRGALERGGSELRVFDREQVPAGCRKSDRELTFNIQGPDGSKGMTGDKGPTGDKGGTGEKGPTGDKGPAGDSGSSGLVLYGEGPGAADLVNNRQTAVSQVIPAGSYSVQSKLYVANGDDDDQAYVNCYLMLDSTTLAKIEAVQLDDTDNDTDAGSTRSIALQTALKDTGGGTLSLQCEELFDSDLVYVRQAFINAIKLSDVQ